MEIPDLAILEHLCILYAPLDTEDVSILVTCPSGADTVTAMQVALGLGLEDIETIFNYLKHSNDENEHTLLTAIPRLNNQIKSAFDCGFQVYQTLAWYRGLLKARTELLKSAQENDVGETLVQAFTVTLVNPEITSQMEALRRVARVMTGFVGNIESNLKRIYPSISLPPKDSERANRFIDELSITGINEYLLDDVVRIAGKRGPLSELVDSLERQFREYIIPYLQPHAIQPVFKQA